MCGGLSGLYSLLMDDYYLLEMEKLLLEMFVTRVFVLMSGKIFAWKTDRISNIS